MTARSIRTSFFLEMLKGPLAGYMTAVRSPLSPLTLADSSIDVSVGELQPWRKRKTQVRVYAAFCACLIGTR